MNSLNINTQSSIAVVNNNGKQEIYVWGSNTYGQLGLGDTNNRLVPTLLDSSTLGNYLSIKEISLMNSVGTATVNTLVGPQVYVWGNNTNGQLGIGNSNNQSSPVLFDITLFGDIQYTNIKELKIAAEDTSATSTTSYAIVVDKSNIEKIFVWGQNNLGQLGVGDITNRNTPTLFDTARFGLYRNIKKFVFTSSHSVAIIEYLDNTLGVFLWGNNVSSQCVGSEDAITSPRQLTRILNSNTGQLVILDNSLIKDAGVGLDASYLILTRNGIDELYTWGRYNDGQMGHINSTGASGNVTLFNPSWLGNPTEILSVNISKNPYAVVKISGVNQVYVWGFNNVGTPGVGQPTSVLKIAPTRFNMSSIGNPLEIYDWSFNYPQAYTSKRFAYVKTVTGDILYVWGENANGQLGIGNTTNSTVPVIVTGINLASAKIKQYNKDRFNTSFILEKNGKNTLYATGWNTPGQLGIGNTTQSNSFIEILPTRYTNPRSKVIPSTNLTSSQALELINPNNTLNRTELEKYVDITTNPFPTGATLSIDPATTTSDYKNGILNLGIKTSQYNDLLIVNTVTQPKTFNVAIPGFRPVTDVNTNPVSVIIRDADGNNIDKIYDQLVDSTYKVINRDLLEYYFDLSSIPPNAVIHLYRTSFGNDTEATFTLTSSQVYGNNGLIVSNQLYVKTDLVWTFTSSQLNLALVISLSVVGGLLLIGAIIAIMLVRRSSNRLII